ncbi:MAG: hypothetical protein CMI29_06480 [Opitutae bacterium]|nr:hypothetical protein [Opitutae bacterium]|tara:strand:+ start:1913 stop:2122 length:210 start_codon:yes stop_codon:yes gene_type:complete
MLNSDILNNKSVKQFLAVKEQEARTAIEEVREQKPTLAKMLDSLLAKAKRGEQVTNEERKRIIDQAKKS